MDSDSIDGPPTFSLEAPPIPTDADRLDDRGQGTRTPGAHHERITRQSRVHKRVCTERAGDTFQVANREDGRCGSRARPRRQVQREKAQECGKEREEAHAREEECGERNGAE